ncbi:MAG: signal recognition particle-docking protein FtsY [Rhodobacter sp.]|nr:signal recognition particle-docking protein FtsY [Rhodobacter sp.]
MSFFKKLRDRMFKSSDRIAQGLDSIVEEAPPDLSPAVSDSQTNGAPARPGLLGRLLGGGDAARRVLDDAMLESLEDLLIQADMGVDTARRVAANLATGRLGRRVSAVEIRLALADEITRIMDPVARPMPLYPTKPQVVLVVGVNGSGKTTTIGKLASQFRAAGKSVVIAAGDTFRAAAVEQLQIWGDRAGVPVMTAPEGSDPASLAFDAMTRAQETGADLLLIDTAGRLQNRTDLMEELAKIVRVIRKKDPSAPHNTLLVLDATTGQNALLQVEIFRKIADVSGLVMTKLDGTAKGGVLVALADKFGLPIHAIGVGEQIDDLSPFDPQDFARALVGIDGAA